MSDDLTTDQRHALEVILDAVAQAGLDHVRHGLTVVEVDLPGERKLKTTTRLEVNRHSLGAALAMVCHRSSRGSPRMRCTSTGRPSRSPSAKWTLATSAGSRPVRSAVSTTPSTMYAGGSTATRSPSSAGTPCASSRSRRS